LHDGAFLKYNWIAHGLRCSAKRGVRQAKTRRKTRCRCGNYLPPARRRVRLSQPRAANSGLGRPRPRDGELSEAGCPAWLPAPFCRAASCN
jgi:hypothetical protein